MQFPMMDDVGCLECSIGRFDRWTPDAMRMPALPSSLLLSAYAIRSTDAYMFSFPLSSGTKASVPLWPVKHSSS